MSTYANVLCQLEQSMGCVENGITKLEILGAMLKYVHCLDAELDGAILKLVCICIAAKHKEIH